jgi:hypothetical protein
VLPDCRFELAADEGRLLDARWLDGSRKNISLDGEWIGGSNARGADTAAMRAMIARSRLRSSDQVMHAVVSGQYMMEQTLHVPLDAMRDREATPLAVLGRLSGHAMT